MKENRKNSYSLQFNYLDDYQSGILYENKIYKGISEDLVRQISNYNSEPEWMLKLRLNALKIFFEKKLPNWGPNLNDLNLNEIYYFAKPVGSGENKSWEDIPEKLKETFVKLGIPEAEGKYLSGVGAQYDSNTIYHSLKKEFADLGVIFCDMNEALKNIKYEKIIKEYFSKCIPIGDHKFASLHYAVWSGGTFLYVPKGVCVNEPLQSYFRMNKKSGGQFEHTIIIIEEGAKAHYIEGCSAPKYDTNSLHAGAVEIFVKKGANMRYSSVENWSIDTYNLNTKRSIVDEDGYMEWVGGNMGSGVTMLYPCTILKGNKSKSKHLGVAFANKGQNQDTGAKVIHIGEKTSSEVLSKSLSKGGGISTFRGLIDIKEGAIGSVSKVDCDGLILDELSQNNAIPTINVKNAFSTVGHEASAGKINEEFMYYLQSRGIKENDAMSIIVNGFLSGIVKELPMEYASEMNVLISMEFEGAF